MVVLGLNAFHPDSAAALVVDGTLVAAAEEERFRRAKHWAGFPSEAIAWCLEFAGLTLRDVDIVAVNSDPAAGRWRRMGWALTRFPGPQLVMDRLRTRRKRSALDERFASAFPGQGFRARIERLEHHQAHLASAFYPSGFERALAVSVDGFGDFASAAWGVGDGAALSRDGSVWFPHSLGQFYQALTQYLGFPHYGDEYKVMGLAPYGQPLFVDRLRQVLRSDSNGNYRLNLDFFRFHRERVSYDWDGDAPQFGTLFSQALERLLGPARRTDEPLEQRHKDIARSAQAIYEDALFTLLRSLHARCGLDTIGLAGGCAQNSVANGKIARETPFRNVYIAAAGYDAGGAVGAALLASAQATGQRPRVPEPAYLGPGADASAIEALLGRKDDEIRSAGCVVEHVADESVLCARVAGHIAAGDVIGWFQGRMEWGPRALGNRSILADPRRADMKDILNRKIKRRESFRPFAPSVLREAVSEWFEQNGDVPFMGQVFPIQSHKRALIPAVTHVDGTGRLQTVTRAENPRYYALIEAFDRLTGVPMVLNTSFSENEPIVCRPEEALDCFLRTRMDVLVLGNAMLTRNAGAPA